jgi:N-formylglutamate amidohydrolase
MTKAKALEYLNSGYRPDTALCPHRDASSILKWYSDGNAAERQKRFAELWSPIQAEIDAEIERRAEEEERRKLEASQ